MVIDMNEYKNIPKIRFKGFNDVWEQRKLNEFTRYISSNLSISDSINNGKYNLYDANNIIGKVNCKNISEEFITIIKDGSGVGKVRRLPKNSCFIGTMGGILSKESNIDFVYCCLLNTDFTKEINGATIPHIYYSNYGNNEYYIPKCLEQVKLGELFTNIDNLITLHQRKYEKLINVKKSLLEKMFPKNFSKLPEIRFKGFTDVWEQRKLGDVGYAKSGQGFPDAEQGGTRGIPFYKVSDMNITGNENELITANNYVTLEQINKNHWNIINDVPAIFFAKVGAAVMLNRKRLCRKSFLLDNNTMAYMFDKSKWNYNFGKTLFDTIDLTLLAQIGAIPSYNASDVENIEILMPHLKEQEKIGKLFTNLDNLITLHQRKLEKLSQIKKSLLDKMFV